MSGLTSIELNYLVFRYLHESGFAHSAFVLGYEAGINRSSIDGNLIPTGALVTFVQKGLQYLELEANTDVNDADVDDDFSFLQPLDLITRDVSELRRIIKEKKESIQKEKEKQKDKEKEREREHERERERGRERERERQEREKEKEREREKLEKERERDKEKEKEREKEKEKGKEREKEKEKDKREKEKEKQQDEQRNDRQVIKESDDKAKVKQEDNDGFGGPEPMDICSSSASVSLSCEIPSANVSILEGHTSEVFACAWSPTGSLLASGSGDSTARIWMIGDGPCGLQSGSTRALVLKHFKGKTNEKSKDVTTLDWNGDGTLLATGSYDGQARLWSRDGELRSTLNKHKGPIFSLKWNKKGDLLLSGSVDKTAIVWDVKTGECKQQFEFHTAPALDVDWRNNVSFATCSTDAMIYMCKVGESRPVKTFAGHQGEVNAIKWDPTGSLLASCSDDATAKIWSTKEEECLHDLREHSQEIYTIRWSPTGPGTSNPNQQLILASASFDSTIKLWDVERGNLLYSLNAHNDPVYSVAFSPNGEYLASGSLDKCLHIWSVKDGKVVKTYRGNGGIFEVCWNKEGDKVAACFSNNTVCVVDFKM